MSTPGDLAACDQQLAQIEQRLNLLIAIWGKAQAEYDKAGLDRLDRLMAFAITDTSKALDATGAYVALTLAIRRLAEK